MMLFIKYIVLIAIIMTFSGCASYMVYKDSEHKVMARKVLASGDQAAIKAMQFGNGAVGVGIDVTKWETLKEQPWIQIGAAILDSILLYAGYKGTESLNQSDKPEISITINGDRNNTHIVRGDNNHTTSTPEYDSDNNNNNQ